jgi:hypothetical protein
MADTAGELSQTVVRCSKRKMTKMQGISKLFLASRLRNSGDDYHFVADRQEHIPPVAELAGIRG